jgi:hypothetical protein
MVFLPGLELDCLSRQGDSLGTGRTPATATTQEAIE